MSNRNALMNPMPKEVTATSSEEENAPGKFKPNRKQLGLNIDSNAQKIEQLRSTWKVKLKRRLDKLEVSSFWKNPGPAFMIMSFLSNVFILLVGGIITFNKLNPDIQIFYDPIEKTWIREFDKSYIFVIAIFLIIVSLIQFRLIETIYKSDKRLSITLTWIMTFLNVCLFIAISQIYNLNS